MMFTLKILLFFTILTLLVDLQQCARLAASRRGGSYPRGTTRRPYTTSRPHSSTYRSYSSTSSYGGYSSSTYRSFTTRRSQFSTTPRYNSNNNVGWNVPPKPGSSYQTGQQPQNIKIVNKYNYHYPGYYSLPVQNPSYPGYYHSPSSYHYGVGDTGSTALGFFLGYSLAKLTTPTFSHYSFYDGYKPRYDHYEVHHYYHNKDSVPQKQEIQANTIIGCVGDSGKICPTNTTSLCTSNGAIMCVASAITTVPCSENHQVNCVTSTISCVNNTAPECKNSNQNSTTISIPCVSKAEVYGELKTVNNTIIPVNGTIGLPANNTYQNNTEPVNATTPQSITTTPTSVVVAPLREKRQISAQNFCVTVVALPAKKKETEDTDSGEIQSTHGIYEKRFNLEALAYRTTRRTVRTTTRRIYTTRRTTTARPTTRRTTLRTKHTTNAGVDIKRTTQRPTTRHTATPKPTRKHTTTSFTKHSPIPSRIDVKTTTRRPTTKYTTTPRPTTRLIPTPSWIDLRTTRRPTTRYTTTSRPTTRRYLTTTTRPSITKKYFGFQNVPLPPGKEPKDKKQKIIIKNEYNYHYPGFYTIPVPNYNHPGYYRTYSSYHYTPSDTGSGVLGFYLDYKLAKLTTPTYSHQSFYDGYRPKYDHYTVHHYYHNGNSIPKQQRFESNSIIGCVGDSTSICPTNTTSLCTNNGTLMCVVPASSIYLCKDSQNQTVPCTQSTISCTNNTAPECKNKTNGTIIVDIPCVSTTTINGRIQVVNNTIMKTTHGEVNQTVNCTRSLSCLNNTLEVCSNKVAIPVNVSCLNGNLNCTSFISCINNTHPACWNQSMMVVNNTHLTCGMKYLNNSESVYWKWKRQVPQEFCVTVVAMPARRPSTQGEEFFADATKLFKEFIEKAWNL